MSKSRAEMTAEELEAVRKEQRERKQRSRDKQRAERERQKQIQVERDNPHAIWQRNRVERADEYAAILQRQSENQDDLAWLQVCISYLKAGKEPEVEDVLNVAASALLNIEQYGYDDHLYCPTEWLQEFTFARESALRTIKNVEYYEFGVAGLRAPRELWTQFVELAGTYIKGTMPDWEQDETARRIVGSMRQPAPTYERGAMRECPSCHARANASWVPDSIWDEYTEKGIQYRCHMCRDAERQSRAQATSTILGSTSGKDTIFGGFGRKHV